MDNNHTRNAPGHMSTNSEQAGITAQQILIAQQMAYQQMAAIQSQYSDASQAARIAALLAKSPPGGAGRTDVHDEISRMAEEDVEETYSKEVFSSYAHHEVIRGCHMHPGNIVEAGSLAALPLPAATYPLVDSIPKALIDSCQLSGLQLEGILYACQRHQILLKDGSRAGFFLGDGAGVGKGRQISGIILDNYVRGRKRHVWFSISSDLVVDARRDLTDINCHIKVIEGCQELDKETRVLGLPTGFKEGVVFSTYSTLVSSVKTGGALSTSRTSRLQQLVNWCGGEDFEGCLIFDECHKAKNFVPGKESASTKVALAVTQVQRLLPKARVVYCSATGVSDVKNMAFMERLGLWGEGAPFKSFEQFLDTVQSKGLGLAEMIAMEMKSAGMYISRGLSFKHAEFTSEEIVLTKDQIKMYDVAAHVWNEVRKSLIIAMERTHTINNRIWSTFWGCHQRFFRQMCIGLKIPMIVEAGKRAVDEGYSVIYGLQTTGEASLESEAGRLGHSPNEFISLCREILSRFIETHMPTVISTVSPNDEEQEDKWCVTAKKMLLDFSKSIPLPNSPLDQIIDAFGGPENVAEMTGRKARMIRNNQNEKPRYELRGSERTDGVETLNVRERNLFMSGKKNIAIISDAASTGISLHADMKCLNQRRRIHITIELPWSADKAVQQLGRSHRSNQSSGPIYKLFTTNLGGERRFAAAIAKRLQSLGALTKGDRRAASGVDLTEFNFDTLYGRRGLKAMYAAITNIQHHMVPGVDFQSVAQGLDETSFKAALKECLDTMMLTEFDPILRMATVKKEDQMDVGKFLNRCLGLGVKKQHLIFNYFCLSMEAQIKNAKKEGRYNEGLVDITASSLVLAAPPREVFKHVNKGNNQTHHLVLTVDRGMAWEKALIRLANHPEGASGFYTLRRSTGKHMYILATLKEGTSHTYKIARPNTGVSSFDEDETDLNTKFIKVSSDEAEDGWKRQYEESKDQCIHGPQCRAAGTCTVGSRCYRMHLLSGGIVTLMSTLDATLTLYGPRFQLSKAESALRVVRAELDNGERVVGVRFPEMLIPLVEQQLRDRQALDQVSAKQMEQTLGSALLPSSSEGAGGPLSSTLQHVQPVDPVIDKLVKRVSQPPLTMHSFFKVKPGAVNEPNPASKTDPTLTDPVTSAGKHATSFKHLTRVKLEPGLQLGKFSASNCNSSGREAKTKPVQPESSQHKQTLMNKFLSATAGASDVEIRNDPRDSEVCADRGPVIESARVPDQSGDTQVERVEILSSCSESEHGDQDVCDGTETRDKGSTEPHDSEPGVPREKGSTELRDTEPTERCDAEQTVLSTDIADSLDQGEQFPTRNKRHNTRKKRDYSNSPDAVDKVPTSTSRQTEKSADRDSPMTPRGSKRKRDVDLNPSVADDDSSNEFIPSLRKKSLRPRSGKKIKYALDDIDCASSEGSDESTTNHEYKDASKSTRAGKSGDKTRLHHADDCWSCGEESTEHEMSTIDPGMRRNSKYFTKTVRNSEQKGSSNGQINVVKRQTKLASSDAAVMTCPICNKNFAKATWVSEINAHIDKCLAKF